MSDLSGQHLGRYQVEKKLGEGGMAVVYRARDTHLERDVAIKFIRVDVFPPGSLEQILRRFNREARALARLTHANIVGVIDYGENAGVPYLVMEYLGGGSLQERMGATMPYAQAARIISLIAGAIAFAHDQGIIHRDIKPGNILFTTSGDPMLSDFGIAKLLDIDDGTATLTGSGFMVGTPEYMAPEQWLGKTVPASDQYSLGMVLYQLVTGRKPYTAATPAELMLKQATETFPRPRDIVSDLPAPLEQVILTAMAKEPQDRYPDMRAFAAALSSLAQTAQSPSPAVDKDLTLPPDSKIPRPVTPGPSPVRPNDQGTLDEPLPDRPVTPRPAPGPVRPTPTPTPMPAPGPVRPAPTPAPGPVRPAPTPAPVRPDPVTPPAPSKRRVPLLLIGGGLVGGGLLVMALLAVGLFFILSHGPGPDTTATPAPTVAAVEATAVVSTTVAPATAPTQAEAGPAAPGKVGTLRVILDNAPDTLDPQKASMVNEIDHLRLIYEGLTRLDEKFNVAPGAAEKWAYNADATQLTFTLRKGLKYSDGSLLNAKRFEYSILRNIDPMRLGGYASITDPIQGAREWRLVDITKASKAEQQGLKDAVGVKALDASGQPCTGYDQPDCLTLRLTFSRPAPSFHIIMSMWVAYPAKEELITNGDFGWWKNPKTLVGNGPMMITEIQEGASAAFKPNSFYWRGTARVNIVFKYTEDSARAFKDYQDNQADIIALNSDNLIAAEADPALNKQVLVYPGSCTNGIAFNLLKEPFNDKAVREAFAYSVDREGFVKDVLRGLGSPTLTWIPKGFPGYDAGENRFAYDPAKTKSLLEAAGYAIANGQLTRDGKVYPIALTFTDSAFARARYQWLADKWKADLGLEVKVTPYTQDDYNNSGGKMDTSTSLFLIGWCADYPDPQNWLSSYWESSTSFARDIGFKDEAFDIMIDQADSELDSARRLDLYDQAQKRLIGDAAGVMLNNELYAYLVRPSVKGIVPTAQDAGWPGSIDPLTINVSE